MTEETIIDGIDVSGCGFLDNHRPTKLLLCNECESDFAAMECKDYHDCYYKQMKRLEQDKNKYYQMTLDDEIQMNELWQENAKLKEILKSVRGYFIVLENIIPTKMLAEGSGVFGAINDAKKEIDEVLNDKTV